MRTRENSVCCCSLWYKPPSLFSKSSMPSGFQLPSCNEWAGMASVVWTGSPIALVGDNDGTEKSSVSCCCCSSVGEFSSFDGPGRSGSISTAASMARTEYEVPDSSLNISVLKAPSDINPLPSTSGTQELNHIREKAEGNPFNKCQEEGCEKAFKTASQLRAHIRWHKLRQGFCCSWPNCNLWFETNSALEIHMKTHTMEKPYMCQICNRDFASSLYLDIHVKTHDSNAIVCSQPGCGAVFKNVSELTSHMTLHEGHQQHICDLPDCEIAFVTKQNLE